MISVLASAARDFIYRSAGLEAQSLAGLITNVPTVMKALIHSQSTLEAQGTLDSGANEGGKVEESHSHPKSHDQA